MSRINDNLLPAYAVFKVLAKENVKIDQILEQFIATYVNEKNRYRFTINSITEEINKFYGFKLPAAIIKAAINKMEGVTAYNGHYNLKAENVKKIAPIELDKYRLETEELLCSLFDFAEKQLEKKLSKSEIEELKNDFLKYFSTNNYYGKYTELISSFGLFIEEDSSLKSVLDMIKYGSLIYKGISSDTDPDKISSIEFWNTELTLYLDTEILFDICGYNGTLYKTFADEFLNLVREINKKKEYVKLRYYKCTKKEINTYFKAAEILLIQNGIPETTAMEYIVDYCKETSDLVELRALFDAELYKNNIYLDSTFSIDNTDSESENEEVDYSWVRYSEDYVKYIDYLREGNHRNSFREIKYVFVTRTSAVLQKSIDRIRMNGGGVPLAMTLETLTSKFWFALNKGFGQDGSLESFDFINRCRVVYAKAVNDEKQSKIIEAKEMFKEKKISEEQAITVIAGLKRKASTPENTTKETVAEYNYLRNASLSSIQEKWNKDTEERDGLKREKLDWAKKELEYQTEIKELSAFKKRKEAEENSKIAKKNKRKKIVKKVTFCIIASVLYVIWIALLFGISIGTAVGIYFLIKRRFLFSEETLISIIISVFLGVLSIIISVVLSIRNMNPVKFLLKWIKQKLSI